MSLPNLQALLDSFDSEHDTSYAYFEADFQDPGDYLDYRDVMVGKNKTTCDN